MWGKFFLETVITSFNYMTLNGGAWRGGGIASLILNSGTK